MPYRKEEFINEEIYHIILKSLDDNLIFRDINDYYRGIFSIYEFNNNNPVSIWLRRYQRKKEKDIEKALQEKALSGQALRSFQYPERDKLVEILSFSFMPNHIHLLVRQLKENGITKFMRKTGTGYACYFNKKYKRKGYLFQNRFLAVHIKNDNQLRTVFVYIHINPISLIEPNWKEVGIRNPERVIKFLEQEYRWSSYFDYIGKKNFPSVTDREWMLEIMGGIQGCRDFVNDWIRYKKELSKFDNLFLE